MVNCTEHTYSIHWFNGGRLDEEMKLENKRQLPDLTRYMVIHWNIVRITEEETLNVTISSYH